MKWYIYSRKLYQLYIRSDKFDEILVLIWFKQTW